MSIMKDIQYTMENTSGLSEMIDAAVDMFDPDGSYNDLDEQVYGALDTEDQEEIDDDVGEDADADVDDFLEKDELDGPPEIMSDTKLYNSKSVYSQANILYGTVMDTTNFEDILLAGWELIGNKRTRLYRYTTDTYNKRIQIPCNVEIIEAVFSALPDARTSQPYNMYPDVYNQWIEQYIESWKINKSVFYNKGALLPYRLEGEYLVFDRDYTGVTILYRGIIVDEEGLPYLNYKEVNALAAYCAYVDMYKSALVKKDGNLLQLANAMKIDWLRLCNAARMPIHLTQNEMNDVLNVKTRWDRKVYGKSFKPII